MMWGGDWTYWWVGALMMILFWGAVVALIVWAVRSSGGGSSKVDRSSPRDILAERFARGEISEEEYAQRRRVLEYRGS